MPKPFDLLAEFGKFGLDHKISLRDPTAGAAFVTHVENAVAQALEDPILLQGQRAEAMFEALVVSLGEFAVLKAEDAGRLFPADRFRAADFRVVLKDGVQWLVEVKNVYEADPFAQRRRLMTRAYYEPLAAYAAATGAQLKLAVFWARWSVWTLVSPERLLDEKGNLDLDMLTAMRVSELAQLGDMTIATRAPMRVRLVMDPKKSGPIGADGMVSVTIGGAQIFSEDRELTDPKDQEIAWILLQYGGWDETGPEAIIEEDRLVALEFVWEPQERSDNGFDFVGSLSRMFARYYAEHTVGEEGVVQLRAPLKPGWFEPLVARDGRGKSEALPLWSFVIQPNFDPPETTL